MNEEENIHEKSINNNKKQLCYVRYTYDRSGAQLLDIIYNYQYCFLNSECCEYVGAIKRRHVRQPKLYEESCNNTKELINYLNFPNKIMNNDVNKLTMIETNDNTSKIITPQFSKFLYNNCECNLCPIKTDVIKNEFIVCVHIRRGDVQKNNKWSSRYTDDKYYLDLIKHINNIKPDAKIYLFSEKCFEKEENYEQYENLGCIFMLGGSLVEAFNYFIQCDLFIMASSSFSIVPAVIKQHGTCIYMWNKYFTPMEHWTICNDIEKDIVNIKKLIDTKINVHNKLSDK